MYELRFWALVLLVPSSGFALGCGASTEPFVRDAGVPMDGAVVRRDAGVDAGPGRADAASPVSCRTATDCTWGEIEHDILAASDCPCLFGCPFAPMNLATAERRNAQYSALCDPRHDGMGNPCGIDDCAMPPPITCTPEGVCAGTMGPPP